MWPHFLLQVETIGDAYEVVSGCPIITKFHAVYIADMALDLVNVMNELPNPSKQGDHLRIRLGTYGVLWLYTFTSKNSSDYQTEQYLKD